jgi:K+-sensing histidine kinase KdpD
VNADRHSALRAFARPRLPELARAAAGALISAALVAAVTGVIFALRGHIPVLALAQLYLFAVIPVAVVWGLAYAVLVSVASMLAFNFFFLPPVHTFTLADSSNWFALAVFLVTAFVVSDLAARSRRRAGVPVDARVETGRTPTHALQRLWDTERFDRIVVPAPVGRNPGFTPKELQWILVHAPCETLILRPDPTLVEGLRLGRSLEAVA